MKKLKVKTGDWIVVCDGRKALILENVADHAFLFRIPMRFVNTRICQRVRRAPMNPAGYTNRSGTPAARLIRRIGMIRPSERS